MNVVVLALNAHMYCESNTFMAARPSDATNVIVSAPKRSQELSDTTNRVLLAQSAHRHYEREQLKIGFVSNGVQSDKYPGNSSRPPPAELNHLQS